MRHWLPSCFVALALVGVPATTCAQEAAGDVQAVLDLTLNTARKGEIRVVLAGDQVWADVAALHGAGLVNLEGIRRIVGDRLYVQLSSIAPPMRVTVDEAALSLTVTAEASLFGGTTVRLDTNRPSGIQFRRTPSAFLNYGASWATSGGQALNLESGLSVRGSLLTSSFFLSSAGQPARGLTAAIVDDTRRLMRYQVGDAIVGTGPLGGSLQLAGVAVSRDFSLDPYFIRYPTTGLAGVVTTPSRVDLYVNNQLVRSGRTLKRVTEDMLYNLFYGGFTQVWGDGTGGTTTYFEHNPPNNKDVVLTVYGRITAGQDVSVGSYTDTVVVTLEY